MVLDKKRSKESDRSNPGDREKERREKKS